MRSAPNSGHSELLAELVGEQIRAAKSSLTCFAVAVGETGGLLVEAAGDSQAPRVSITLCQAQALPQLSEAVCTVDWSWIVGSTIRAVWLTSSQIHLDLDPVGPLDVSALVWNRAPFLAFRPFQNPL